MQFCSTWITLSRYLALMSHWSFSRTMSLLIIMSTLDKVWTKQADLSANVPSLKFFISEELPLETLAGNIISELQTLESDSESVCHKNTGTIWNLYEFDPRYVGLFKLDKTSTSLSVNKRIDREYLCPTTTNSLTNIEECKLEFAAVCQSTKDKGDERWYPLSIFIKDIDDNPPIFLSASNAPLEIRIVEDEGIGFQVELPTAFDADIHPNNLIDYRLADDALTNKVKEYFDLHTMRTSEESVSVRIDRGEVPVLVLKRVLDYETQPNFQFDLLACSSSKTFNCSKTTININLIDANDNSPQIVDPSGSRHEMEVSEALPVGATLIKVHAIDSDTGEAGRITYSLKENSGFHQTKPESLVSHGETRTKQPFLGIGASTGELRLLRSLTLYEGSTLESTVFATDNGEPQRTSSLYFTLFIIDMNNHPPQIEIQRIGCNQSSSEENLVIVSESTKVGSHVGLILVSDDDRGNNGEVECHTENLNGPTYDLALHFPLIRMGTVGRQYLHVLQVAHGAIQSGVQANGLDNAIHSLLRSERQPKEFPLLIVCSDLGTPNRLTSSVTLIIRVTDRQESQVCFEYPSYRVSIEETPVQLMHLLNPQLQQLVPVRKFRFYGDGENEKACQQVRVDQTTGELFALHGIDREVAEEFVCTLSAEIEPGQGGYHTVPRLAQAQIAFIVSDVNDNPPTVYSDILANGFSLLEWDGLRTGNSMPHFLYPQKVGTVLANDPDAGENGTITFIIQRVTVELCNKSQSVAMPRFQIGYHSGEISLSQKDHRLVDRETVRFYQVHLILHDNSETGRQSSHQTVRINVVDLNDNRPVWRTPFTYGYSQEWIWLEVSWRPGDARLGEYLGQITAQDDDEEGKAKVMYRRLAVERISKLLLNGRQIGPQEALFVHFDGHLKLYHIGLRPGIKYVFGVQAYDVGDDKKTLSATGFILVQLPLKYLTTNLTRFSNTTLSLKAMHVEYADASAQTGESLNSDKLRLLLTSLSTIGILLFVASSLIAVVLLIVRLRRRAKTCRKSVTHFTKPQLITPDSLPAYPEFTLPMNCDGNSTLMPPDVYLMQSASPTILAYPPFTCDLSPRGGHLLQPSNDCSMPC